VRPSPIRKPVGDIEKSSMFFQNNKSSNINPLSPSNFSEQITKSRLMIPQMNVKKRNPHMVKAA
jgi:hypothetical protein